MASNHTRVSIMARRQQRRNIMIEHDTDENDADLTTDCINQYPTEFVDTYPARN